MKRGCKEHGHVKYLSSVVTPSGRLYTKCFRCKQAFDVEKNDEYIESLKDKPLKKVFKWRSRDGKHSEYTYV